MIVSSLDDGRASLRERARAGSRSAALWVQERKQEKALSWKLELRETRRKMKITAIRRRGERESVFILMVE